MTDLFKEIINESIEVEFIPISITDTYQLFLYEASRSPATLKEK